MKCAKDLLFRDDAHISTVRVHERRQARRTMIKSVRVALEVVVDATHDGFVADRHRQVFFLVRYSIVGSVVIDAHAPFWTQVRRRAGQKKVAVRLNSQRRSIRGDRRRAQNREFRPVVLEAFSLLAPRGNARARSGVKEVGNEMKQSTAELHASQSGVESHF